MANDIPEDLAEKAAVMEEFRSLRAAGKPVPADLYAKHVQATNDRYTTGPELGQRIPDFSLSDQSGQPRSLTDLAGPNGLLLVFHRSAEW
jgi:cytochrome oxidase Cu insertion factor (SCO1/SenC/PrrC family)